MYVRRVETGAILTRATIWLALAGYLAALPLFVVPAWRAKARICWVIGFVSFLAHIVAAFHFYHHWSHSAAWEDTRRQTLERTGFDFGGGIYFNYLYALVWLMDCAPLLGTGRLLQEKSRAWWWALHAFFLFMIFNATVVFGNGWAKPAGAVVCVVAAVCLYRWRTAVARVID